MRKERNNKEENENMKENTNMDEENLNENSDSLNSEEVNLVKIGQLENETAELKDKLLRKAAEFENYKRRTENDLLNSLKYSAEGFITAILPIVDDFERSLKHLETAKDVSSIKAGIELIYEKLMKLLNDNGVKKIDAVGKPFDVEYHDAMLQRHDDMAEPNAVLDEIQAGYIYKDRVIRHAKVIVSDETSGEASGTDNTKSEDDEDLNN